MQKVTFPARQRASTPCSSNFCVSRDLRVHQSWYVASQHSDLIWCKPGVVPHLGLDAEASVQDPNPWRGGVATAADWVMARVPAERGGRCYSSSIVTTALSSTVCERRTRLEACVQADGGHFEEPLWRCLRDHFSTPFRTTQQPALFRATHFFPKKTA